MTDLIERLRFVCQTGDLLDTAADEIERLRAALAEARKDRQITEDATADEVHILKAYISELQENGERLRLIADEAVRTQREMIEAVAGPLRAEIIRLRKLVDNAEAVILRQRDERHAALAQQSQPLTDDQIKALPAWWPSYDGHSAIIELIRAVEAAHGIKETK